MTTPRPAKRTAANRRARPNGGKTRTRTKDEAKPVVTVPPVPAEEEQAATGNGAARRASSRDTGRSDEMPRWVRRAIAYFFGWVAGLLVAYWALNKLRPILFMVAVALFLSLAMEPPVNALTQRGWRRGTATGLVVGTVLLGTIGFFAAFGSVAFTQASQLVNNAPHYVRNIVSFINDEFGTHINANGLINELQSHNGAVQKFARSLANSAPDVALTIGKAIFQIVVTFIFAFYLTADGPRVRRIICSRLPRRRQEIVLDTWELAVQKTGAYLYSRTLQAAACTAAVWIFLFLLGVPSALALAIWVGIVSQFVPTVGTYIALVLPALVTLVNSPVDTIWVIAYLVGYQQFENYVLGPRIARFTLHIHPALTIGSVFAGVLLFGPVGALLALPVTAVLQALLSTYTHEEEVIESPLTAEPESRERRFRIPRFSLRRQPAATAGPAEPSPAPRRRRRADESRPRPEAGGQPSPKRAASSRRRSAP